jgi:16S rRNA (guanine966-N2)-methyltransferase
MRIVAGEWRGRPIGSPAGHKTRPTTDRVREALFSTLGSLLGEGLGGGGVLDAFAGSGALGLEALSRGGERAVFVERDRKALSALRANIEKLGAKARASVLVGDAFVLAARGALTGPFALILLDPPYTLDPASVRKLLETLDAAGAVRDGAIASWERSTSRETDWPTGWDVVTVKRYGDTAVEIAVFERGEQGQ